jgi:pyridoxal phosphate enzyme (YggS family)
MFANEGIEHNLVKVRQRIVEAAARVNRDPRTVRLLAVSKNQPISALEEAYRIGQRRFAENRVQEWLEKGSSFKDCEWHLVGSLQTNKVKYLDQSVSLIHSLDRLSLLKTLNKQGERRGIIWPTLVQVNIARDPAKSGFSPEEVSDFLDLIGDYSQVKVLGLMTIGALEASAMETRGFFQQLKVLRDTLQSKLRSGVDLRELSMGMSEDYEIAVEEGATLVRIGRQIFGERRY